MTSGMIHQASIIVSFYNKIEWLKLVLAGLERQSNKNFEVLVSDDGSRKEVVDEIRNLESSYSFSIKHVWHEDDGWRKNIILNKAIVRAGSDYLIFMDGDCVPHRHFVKEHLKHAAFNYVLAGRRVNLPHSVTSKLTPALVQKGYLEKRGLLRSFWAQRNGLSSHNENGIYARLSFLQNWLTQKDTAVLGSNFSIHKKDILAVNGFDERYTSPAVGEDDDLELRLRNNGMKVKKLKHIAIQYHLFHKTLPYDDANWSIYNANKEGNVTYTPFGIEKR
jgi:glycosyltransferase involved in cell wall biosynthesis